MARYDIEFGKLGDSRPVPNLTVQTTDLNTLDRAVAEHARPHILPVLTAMGHPEYADALFRMNRNRTMGQFLHIDLVGGCGVQFLAARITTTPERIQRKRTKGWTAPSGAKYVGRGSRWGNPFIVGQDGDNREHAAALHREWLENNSYDVHAPTITAEQRQQMDARRDHLLATVTELRGRDLMCWCPLPEPGQPDHCHAPLLIALANAPKEN